MNWKIVLTKTFIVGVLFCAHGLFLGVVDDEWSEAAKMFEMGLGLMAGRIAIDKAIQSKNAALLLIGGALSVLCPWAAQADDPGGAYIVGVNVDVDAAEDLFDGTGDFTFGSVGTTTTLVSSNAQDDSHYTTATGALTVLVEGLDNNYKVITETVSTSGTVTTTLTNKFLQIHSATVLTAGTDNTNTGTITIGNAATTTTIRAMANTSFQGAYIVPQNLSNGQTVNQAYIIGWGASLAKSATTTATVELQTKEPGGVWITHYPCDLAVVGQQTFDYKPGLPIEVNPKSYIRLRATGVGATNLTIRGYAVLRWRYPTEGW